MVTFSTFVLWLHLSAIAVWVGGLFTVSFVSVPVLRAGVDSPTDAARLAAMMLRRFQRISREIILLILLTGMFNVINAGMARGFNFSDSYILTLLVKLSLFVTIVAVQAWQSLRLAPALGTVANHPTGEDTARLHRRLMLTSLINLVLGVAAILLGLSLRYRG